MGYQVYIVGRRWGGYGVPAICEYPTCKKIIDRGVSYACGGEPFSEHGCDRYFCGKHLIYTGFKDGEVCKHEQDIDGDCDCECVEVCERCSNDKSPFPYKPERSTWIRHILEDESWAKWRNENYDEVEEMRLMLPKKNETNKIQSVG